MPDAFESEQVEFMRGKIASGLGQAQYFLTREGYSRQLLQHLGFVPFPGTLNVLLEEPFPAGASQAIKIESFQEEGKTFGECKCYRIEVIASVQLRRTLGLEDGDLVEVILL